jgi:hypothetical protein
MTASPPDGSGAGAAGGVGLADGAMVSAESGVAGSETGASGVGSSAMTIVPWGPADAG